MTNEQIGKDDDRWRRASPTGFRTRGMDFVDAGVVLLEAHQHSLSEQQRLFRTPPFPVYYNLLHGIELLLKSFLLHTGVTLQNVENRVGHKIDNALNDCLKRGLLDVCPHLNDTMIGNLRAISPMYASKEFEYLSVGATHLPHVEDIQDVATELVGSLRRLTMATAQPAHTSKGR